MDKVNYLSLIEEFETLLNQSDNKIYRQGERSIDYLGLMLHSVIAVSDAEVPRGDSLRIVWVHDQLSSLLENANTTELWELREFLNQNGFRCSISNPPGEINFAIRAETFDFIVIID